MSKTTFECIDFRTARRLAAHGWTIYSRDTGEGWQFGPGCSARYVRRRMSEKPEWVRFVIIDCDGKVPPKVLTFRAIKEEWKWG